MAFLMKANSFSQLRSHFQIRKEGMIYGLKVAPGPCEEAIFAGICYEIYVKATMREEAREKAHKSN